MSDSYYNMEKLTGEIMIDILDTINRFIEKKKPNPGTETIEVMSSILTGLIAVRMELSTTFGVDDNQSFNPFNRGKE